MHLLRLFVKLFFKFVYCTMVNITSMFRLGLGGDFRLSHFLQLFVKLIFKFFDLYDAIGTQGGSPRASLGTFQAQRPDSTDHDYTLPVVHQT